MTLLVQLPVPGAAVTPADRAVGEVRAGSSPAGAGAGRAVVAIGLAAWFAVHTVHDRARQGAGYLDARDGFFYHLNPSAVQAGEALGSAYDGGKIMIMTGSAQEHRIMLTAGIPLGQYDEIVASSTWKASYAEPWRYDRWLVMSRGSRPRRRVGHRVLERSARRAGRALREGLRERVLRDPAAQGPVTHQHSADEEHRTVQRARTMTEEHWVSRVNRRQMPVE